MEYHLVRLFLSSDSDEKHLLESTPMPGLEEKAGNIQDPIENPQAAVLNRESI